MVPMLLVMLTLAVPYW